MTCAFVPFLLLLLCYTITSAYDGTNDASNRFPGFTPRCKCTSPKDGRCWPSARAWQAFNNTVGGSLLHPLPPAQPCHVPYYNATACAQIAQVYTDRYWRADHPVAMQQPWMELNEDNEGCIGVNNSSSHCLRGNLPYYVVNASSISQVQTTVKFAGEHNLRLVVKNTGHDFFGRSTGKAALSLWLHYFRNIEFESAFVPEECRHSPQSHSAVTVGAGVQLGEVLTASNKRGLELVVGSCPSVGVAGYVQGGGHGLLGPTYGMAADNVLQYKVITADGRLRVANRCKNRDLFWALRGGGGGTYGVVVEITMKTYPVSPIVGSVFTLTAQTDAAYLQLVSKLVESIPTWSDKGYAGYFYIYNTRSIIWNALTHNLSSAHSTLAPFFAYVSSTPGLSYTTQVNTTFPSFHPFWFAISRPHDNPIYDNLLLGSWLMPRANFEGPERISQHARALLEVLRSNEGGYVFMMLVGGGAVVDNAGDDNSVNPAWRRALTHQVITANVPYDATIAQRGQLFHSITNQTKIFRDIAPTSGAYTNEADPNQPDWQHAFFGRHYDELNEIKDLYDPNNLFVCTKCVGSEGRTKDLNCKSNIVDG